VITSSPYSSLVEDAKKKKPVNKEGFQSRSQEKNVRNVLGTERKVVYRQKNKSYMKDGTKAEVSMKKLVKWKPSTLQTQKREVLLRISSSLDSEEEMIAHLSNYNEEAECLYCCSLFSEDPGGEEKNGSTALCA
jgi:hypothetical protein